MGDNAGQWHEPHLHYNWTIGNLYQGKNCNGSGESLYVESKLVGLVQM